MRGSAGEHSEADGGMYDISNRERMGLTEFQVCTVQRKGGGAGSQKTNDNNSPNIQTNFSVAEPESDGGRK